MYISCSRNNVWLLLFFKKITFMVTAVAAVTQDARIPRQRRHGHSLYKLHQRYVNGLINLESCWNLCCWKQPLGLWFVNQITAFSLRILYYIKRATPANPSLHKVLLLTPHTFPAETLNVSMYPVSCCVASILTLISMMECYKAYNI